MAGPRPAQSAWSASWTSEPVVRNESDSEWVFPVVIVAIAFVMFMGLFVGFFPAIVIGLFVLTFARLILGGLVR